MACDQGYYLKHSTPGSTSGSCSAIDNTDDITLNVFVAPEYEETFNDGSHASPFGNIVKALEYVEEQSANAGTVSANIIILGGGTHYMTKNPDHYKYDKTASNKYGFNQDITIQPAICGQTLGGHTFASDDSDCISDGSKITVHYKMGNSFMFTVPNGLTFKSIVFDAIDSSIDLSDACLFENTQC